MDSREKAGNLLLALGAGVLPLWPYGPVYLGFGNRAWADLGILLLLLAAVLAVSLCPRRVASGLREGWLHSRQARGWGWIGLVWGAAIIVATGSTMMALMAENLLDTPVFRLHLADLFGRLWRGMSQTADPLYPIRPWLTYLEGWLVFVLLGVAGLTARDARARGLAILYGCAAGMSAVSAFALYQHATGFQLHPYWVRVNPDLIRAHATLDDPNALGSYLVLGIAFLAGLAWQQQRTVHPVQRWGLLVTVLLGMGALMSTVSRAAWAALPVGILVVLAVYGCPDAPRVTRWARSLGVVALLVVGAHTGLRALLPETPPASLPGSAAASLTEMLDPRTPLKVILKHREVWWGAAGAMLLDAPGTGVGVGRFPRELDTYRPDAPAAENAHNFPLQTGAETGWPGILLLLLVAVIVLAVSAGPVGAPRDRRLRVGLLAGLVAFMLTNLTGHPLLAASIQALLATFLMGGLLATYRDGSPPGQPRLARRLAPIVGAVVLISLLASALVARRHVRDRPALDDEWGYSWGLYPAETDAVGEFRWTGARAILLMRVPPGARLIELRYAVTQPIRSGERTRVDFLVDGRLHPAGSHQEARWRAVRLPVQNGGVAAADGTVSIGIDVRPSFTPASGGGSSDERQLGVMLRVPVFLADQP